MSSRLRFAGFTATSAASLALAWNAFYIWILWREHEGDLAEPVPQIVATSICVSAVLLLGAASLRSTRARVIALAVAAVALTALALLAAPSIGILLMPAAALA